MNRYVIRYIIRNCIFNFKKKIYKKTVKIPFLHQVCLSAYLSKVIFGKKFFFPFQISIQDLRHPLSFLRNGTSTIATTKRPSRLELRILSDNNFDQPNLFYGEN